MRQPVLQAFKLNDVSGNLPHYSKARVAGVVITQELEGSLSILGVTTSEGASAGWIIKPKAVGWVAPPGSGFCWGSLGFTLSDEADTDKVYLLLQPQ